MFIASKDTHQLSRPSGLRNRRRLWCTVLAVLLVAWIGMFLQILISPKGSVRFESPVFKLTWDFQDSKNARWKLEEEHKEYDCRFVLHIPKETRVGILPSFDWDIPEGPRWSVKIRGRWSFSFPLTWDGRRLDLEQGKMEPYVSYGGLPGRWTYKAYSHRAAQNILSLLVHFTYTDDDGQRSEERTVSITLEIQED